jgi:hypothetical protein
MDGMSDGGEPAPLAKVRVGPADGGLVIAHEDAALRVAVSGNTEDPGVFLCFTGVGGGVGGVQMEEFVGSTRLPGYFAVYITDKKRSWFNWDVAPVLEVLRPYIEGKSVITIGNSMGGFGAIWMAGVLGNAHACLSFAPQYSVHPEIVPAEKRWWNYREAIRDWRVPSLMHAFAPATRFWTFNGGRDAEHWSKFPQGENLSHFLTRDAGHDVARTLKEAGVLSEVIRDCIEGIDPFDRIAAAGVQIERITPETDTTIQERPGGRRQRGAGARRGRGAGGDGPKGGGPVDPARRRKRRQRLAARAAAAAEAGGQGEAGGQSEAGAGRPRRKRRTEI